MKKTSVKQLAIVIALTGIFLLVATPSVYAASCGGVETSIVSCSHSGGESIWDLLKIAINILTAGVGIVAVGGIILAGLRYTAARENAAEVTKAKEMIRNIVIGLVAYAAMYAFLQFLIPGGVFNRDFDVPAPVAQHPPDNDCGCDDDGGGGDDHDDSLPPPSGNINTIHSVHNIRDASASNNALKPKLLYRSPELSGISASDKRTLQSVLRGGKVIDLRLGGPSDPTLQNVQNVHVPADLIDHDYRSFVNNSGNRQAFGRALSIIANTDRPVLVHCTHGKDRTGWAVALVMYVAGASQSQIMNEYLKSNASGEHVEAAWLNAAFSEARHDYGGSVGKYLRDGLGLDESTIQKLRQKMKA